MAIDTNLQVFYPLSANVDDLANADNGTNSGISFGTHSGVVSADYTAPDHFTVGNSTYNFSFGTGDFTFSVWVNPDTINYGATAQGTLFGTDYPNYELAIYQSKIQCFIGGPGNIIYTTGAAVTTGSWQHVIIRRTGTTVEILVDNSVQASTLGGSPGTSNMTNSGTPQFQSGQRVSSANNHYDGKMSDLCMWKRALTNVEVASIYTAGAGGFSTLLPGPAVLKGVFGSLIHNAPPDVSVLEGMFGSIVHDAPPGQSLLEGMWGSLVHNAPPDVSVLEGMFGSIVHSVPAPAAIVPDITGTPGVPATFDGSASTMASYYRWSWVSVPGGSAITNAPIPFPNSGATAPIDMTGNVALYHFETTGATTPDSSGGGRNLTVNGATQVAGKVGSYAFDFDGTNDFLEYAAADVLPGTTAAISISFWQYGDSGSDNSIIWAQNAAGQRVINIHVPYSGQIYFDCGNTGGSFDRINKSASGVPITGQWTHWVFTKDVSSGEMKIYLNGALWHSGTGKTKSLETITNLYLGAYVPASWGWYDGKMDEVAFWSRVLHDSEVAEIYLAQNGTLAGIGSDTFTFTPDIVGTYQINLAINGSTNTNADCVVTLPAAGGGDPSQGASLQGGGLQGSGVDLQGYT